MTLVVKWNEVSASETIYPPTKILMSISRWVRFSFTIQTKYMIYH